MAAKRGESPETAAGAGLFPAIFRVLPGDRATRRCSRGGAAPGPLKALRIAEPGGFWGGAVFLEPLPAVPEPTLAGPNNQSTARHHKSCKRAFNGNTHRHGLRFSRPLTRSRPLTTASAGRRQNLRDLDGGGAGEGGAPGDRGGGTSGNLRRLTGQPRSQAENSLTFGHKIVI
jgi:hypothetical protein